MSIKSASLYYKDGGSDKVYHTQIEADGGKFVVNFQYGRRGSTLTSGTKTASPVPLDQAEKVFDKLIKEKTAKGYTPGEDGTPFAGTDKAGEVSGLVPQLLNPIERDRVQELLEDDDWFMQEKMDGFHQMARVADEVIISNRKGLIVPGSSKITAALARLIGKPIVLDGEAIGDVYHPFDVLEVEGKSTREKAALDRYFIVNGLLAAIGGPYVTGVRTAVSSNDKIVLFDQISEERGEGVVFKKKDSLYVPGRPNSGGNMLKFKFKANATVKVMGVNTGKRSVMIAAQQDSKVLPGNGPLVGIGNVTIPANFDIPTGGFAEVEYLYAFPGGSLFQTVYKGPRPDKDQADLYSSLKFKQGTTDDEI